MSPITLDEPQAYFDRLAKFETEHWWSAALWRIAEHWLNSKLRGSQLLDALDIGCGAGLTLARLAVRPEIGHVVGIEPSLPAIEHARSRGAFFIVEGSALNLPFASGSFDLVTCLDVIQHLPSGGDRQAIGEMARVLKPGGIAILRSNTESSGLKGLKQVLEANALLVHTASPVNLVGSMLQEVRGRLFPSKHHAHPSGVGLPQVRSGDVIARSMAIVGQIEAYAVGRLGWTLPFGHSVMLLAQKQGSSVDWPSRVRSISGRKLAN